MMKKILAIACCCAPFSAAVAATTIIDPANNPGSNVLDGLTLGAGDAALVQSGNGMALGTGGLSATSVYVGMDSTGTSNGQLFVETAAAADYSIRSDGNISVASLLQVLSGHSLSIGAKTTGSIETVSLGSVMVGSSATETGGLTIQDVEMLNTGNITSWGPLSVTGGDMFVNGTLFSRAGGVNIDLTGELSLDNDLITDGGATSEINVTSLSASSFQNKNGSVTVNLATVDGTNVTNNPLTLTGSLENSGTLMKITGVSNANISGTVKNDSNNGTMIIVADNFSVTGGSDTEASFVNKGDLQMTVSGETSLAYGFDLSAMTEENTFSLNTGTLDLGGNPDQLLQVFSNNKLKSFELIVQNGGITAGNIINGQSNANANMTITTGDDITADLIQNYGNDLIIGTKEDSTGDISITSADSAGTSIVGAAGYTEIIADGTLSAGGAVTNSAKMFLSGNEVELNSVANTGDLTINAQTDPTGSIHLTGDVANSAGSTMISARQVAIDGTVTTNAGTTTIKGSDADDGGFVTIGGIQALGGVTNLDSLIGGATINNSLIVSGGAFNTGLSLFNLVATRGAQIGGDLTFSGTDATDAGDMNVANKGNKQFVLTATNGQIKVDGSVIATENDVARSGALVADLVEVGEDVTATNKGWLTFGDASSNTLKVTGDVTANDNGTVEFYSANATVGSLSGNGRFIMHGDSVVANVGEIDVSNGIWYDGTSPESGMIVNGTEALTLQTTNAGQDITVENGISIANAKNSSNEPIPATLSLDSANDVKISGAVNVKGTLPTGDEMPVASALNVNATNAVEFGGPITTTNGGAVTVTGKTIQTAAIDNGTKSGVSLGNTSTTSVETTGLVKNAGTLDIVAQGVTMSALTATDGVATIAATNLLDADVLDVSGGIVNMSGDSIKSSSMTLSDGSTKLSSDTITVSGDVDVTSGDLAQGGTVGTLILTDNGTFKAANLNVSGGKLLVDGGNVTYKINNTATFGNGIETTAGSATVDAKDIIIGGTVKNAADLTLKTQNNLGLGVVENSGSLVLDAGAGNITAASLDNTGGTAKITAQNMALTGALTSNGVLYQNYAGGLLAGDMNITSTNHTLTTSNLTVAGINQYGSSKMVVKSSDVTVNGSIMAKDLRFQANPAGNWLNVEVTNNVSGGVDFVGLEHMTIGGNYTFNNDSMLHAAILPQPGVVLDSTTYNYWSTVSLNDDNTLGQITNAAEHAAPLISLTGQFVYDVTSAGSELSGGALVSPQIGIDIFDMVDSGSAIWLLHSDSSAGLAELNDKLRNLNVNFCNADGSRCFKYFDNSIAENAEASQTPSNLPAYLTVRDIDEDGVTDSIYIVFDSRFGGPVEVFKIQPIVDRVDDHTGGEHDAAGALDDMIEGGLKDAKFNNRSPIEAIPVAFKGTNLENLANELYKRMEQYTLNRDGTGLARFSRLVQPREIEQLVASVALEEHTFYRDFEDHMFDEFIWNRHRNLEKAWVDVDYGLFYQNASDGKHVNGDRFSIVGGYDWQYSPTVILGFAGHVSHMSADDTDAMDLSYIPGKKVDGNVKFDVSDTDIGVGAYLMKILGLKTRLYGNAFADLHLLDVSRDQNFVSHIDGSGTAFSLITEWGFLHDWLNQYIVGNLYARAGYNFGFSVTEKASGDDYMQLESDGYLIFTPGYSLIAQKRFYPSSWFQIRPYVSAGVEYDVAGTPDYAKFKFGPAKSFTKYDVEIDPLWANIGGGVEMLSVSGFQVGLDYRYQYNNNLQLHKVRLSGSYRF